ncbi:hypothetical protein [Pseudescherichia sp.]|uniref:hypothetical protein n=1 Tax=Pseudescherichia sp. TaxID=2055881 RepID=UPI0028AA9B3B|nr:hypothetical protein [Pseudescherichia sp.]
MHITKTDLKERGWTESLISKFAPEAERKQLTKTRFCYLYNLAEVESVEQSEPFLAAKNKASKRSQSANKAVLSKQEANKKKFNLLIEEINGVELPQREMQYWHKLVKRQHDANDVEGKVLNRWVFNHFRHEYFPYDIQYHDAKGLVGKSQHIKAVQKAIAEVTLKYYPELERAIREYLERCP